MNITENEAILTTAIIRAHDAHAADVAELNARLHERTQAFIAREAKLIHQILILKTKQATGTEAAVCTDIQKRQQIVTRKYGTSVEGNPLPLKAWLQHAYEETLDQATYLKRAISEL